MTRRRIIAGVILLAAVAVAVPAAPGVWERVAYREKAMAGVLIPKFFGEYGKSREPELFFLEKRWSWLPGDDTFIPDQLCWVCRQEHHETCWSTPGTRPHSLAWFLVGDPWAAYRCTCTDPSHDD